MSIVPHENMVCETSVVLFLKENDKLCNGEVVVYIELQILERP